MSYTLEGAKQALGQLLGTYAQGTATVFRYIGLSTTQPSMSGGNITEPKSASYRRTLIAYKPSSGSAITYFGQATSNVEGTAFEVSNNKEIHFNEALDTWEACTHFVIFDSETGGNALYIGELANPISPTANKVPLIRIGDLKITLS